MKPPVPQVHHEGTTAKLYCADGSRYVTSDDFTTGNPKDRINQIVVTGAFPARQNEQHLIETIRDPEDPDRLAFLVWEGGKATIVPHIQRNGRIFVPPDPTSTSFPSLSLADGVRPCGESAGLLAEISSTISKFVVLRQEQLLVVAAFVLATWFPDCFEAAPYLWLAGPLGSAKTKLLKLLQCLCRRGLLAGDMRAGSLYKLTDSWEPTLIVDELEPAGHAELLRMLRCGSVPGVPTYRNGQAFSVYGLKVIALRQPVPDAALSSRGLLISMLPTEDDALPLDELAMQQIQKEFQPKLLMLRLQNLAAVRNFRLPSDVVHALSSRGRQLARALAAPLLGAAETTSDLLAALGEQDAETRVERALEPEWLVGEVLFETCHQEIEGMHPVAETYVGGFASEINQKLELRGEDIRLGAKKVGLVLKGLGVHTERLGRMGRGLAMTSALKRKVHEIARGLGIDRKTIATSGGIKAGYGGAPCVLCEEFGLTAGLRFVHRFPPRETAPPTSSLPPEGDKPL